MSTNTHSIGDRSVALVTGGGRGIGRGIALELANSGFDVAVTYRQGKDQAAATALRVSYHNRRGIAVPLDLERPETFSSAIAATLDAFRRLDVLVLNAGHWNDVDRPLLSLSAEEVRRMLAVHVESVFGLVRSGLAALEQSPNARIILIGSTAGIRGEANHAHYAAAKGALLALARSLAAELGPKRITVNVVAPGWVQTEATAAVLQDETTREAILRTIPTGRLTTPEDVGGAVAFLASPRAAQITGVRLDVNGGGVFG